MSVEQKRYTDEGSTGGESPKHPALKNFNANLQWGWEVIKSTAVTALKGAVIVGLAMAALSFPLAALSGGLANLPLVGGMFQMVGAAGFTQTLLAGALVGLQIGAVGGAAVGLAQGVSNASDAVEEMEHSLVSKYQRAQQLGASHKMLEAQLSRLSAPQQPVASVMAPQMPLPAMGQKTDKNQGFGVPV